MNSHQDDLVAPLITVKQPTKRRNPFFISKIFFWQVYPIIKKATKVPLENDMIDDLEDSNKSDVVYLQFLKIFQLNKHKKYALPITLLKTFKCNDFIQREFIVKAIASFFVLFVQISLDMILPLLIKEIIVYITQKKEGDAIQKGIKLVSAVFLVRFLSTVLTSHNSVSLWQIGTDAYSTLSMALMGKCLKVSLQSNKQHSSGEVLNLMQVDTRKIQWMAFQLRGIVFMPLQICISLYFMFAFIGISFLAGLLVILLTMVFNLKIGQLLQLNQKNLMKAKDIRTKSANELFSAIKFIKINALEEYFIEKLAQLRDKEVGILKSRFLLNGLVIMSVWMSPVLVINATFAMFIFLGNFLDAANAFALIALFQVLQGPLLMLPMIINSLIEAMISMNRVQKFLLTEEIMTGCLDYNQIQNNSVVISVSNGNFYWNRKGEASKDIERKENEQKDKKEKSRKSSIKANRKDINRSDSVSDLNGSQVYSSLENKVQQTQVLDADIPTEEVYTPILKDINIEIQKGQFVAIVGDVGSGKSSLLSALIGEMVYVQGEGEPQVKIQGTIAYVSQKVWIQNATVKDNILFGLPYDEQRYHDALKYSCFTQDIEVLIKGDQTMIGEKGVNLSGGQKARVSLARAIYGDSDIYLLDDPISAVDVHVGKFIMHKCLNGYLKHKTRILVTHALNYTQFADQVYLLDGGSVSEQGTFAEIRNSTKFQRIYEKFYKQSGKNDGSQSFSDELSDSKSSEKEIDEENLEIILQKQLSKPQKNELTPVDLDEKVKREDSIDQLMLEEDRTKGSVEWSTYSKYFNMTGGWWFFFLIGMVQVSWIFTRIGSSLWLAFWTQQSEEGQDIDQNFYLGIYSAFSVFFGIFAYVRITMISLNNIKFANRIHNQMVHCLAYAPQCQFFERVPLGRLMNRFTKDQQVLDNEINWNVSSLYVAIAQLIANTFMNVYGSTIYMIIPIVMFFIFSWLMQRFYMHANRELYRLESISKSPILSFFGESLLGLPTIRAFGKGNQFLNRHGDNMDLNRKIFIEQILVSTWFNLTLSLCSFIVNISAIIFCVFYSTKNPAYAGLLMTYAASLDQNVQQAIGSLASFETSVISFERCLHYTQVKSEQGYQDLVKSKIEQTPYDENVKYVKNWPKDGTITYKDYSVQYRSGLPNALSNLSFIIEPRDKVGVVGRTGAGKSTLTLTLLRILEALEGGIQIDGVDIAQLSLKQLRQSITMIMQDATIFEGSLRDNIDPLQTHSDEDILNVIDQCRLNELCEKREGLKSKIEPDGENLSAGEKQLICIARAVLKKSKIVLIDEATANIDIETEHYIQETIQNVFKDCTVITIAHRVNTILHCDKILVVDKGTIKEYGYTKDLKNDSNSTFYGIFQEALKEQKN